MERLRFYFVSEADQEKALSLIDKEISGEFVLSDSSGNKSSLHEIFIKTGATHISVQNSYYVFRKTESGWVFEIK